jgi:transcriptional regulator with XRE-family HTH domain
MNERVKELRIFFKMSQTEFASRLGIGQAGLSAIEKGIRTLTERNIQLICSEFNVRENWLRYGEGDMFYNIPPEDEYVRAAAEIAKNEDEEIMRQVIVEYYGLNPEGKKLFKNFLYSFVKSIKEKEE